MRSRREDLNLGEEELKEKEPLRGEEQYNGGGGRCSGGRGGGELMGGSGGGVEKE